MKQKEIIIICGPTAGGKSGLSLKIAQDIGDKSGIINADSMQVYQDVPTLTARPSLLDTQSAPHYLYGYLKSHESNSVSGWLEALKPCLEKIEAPIVVGGTGFYIDALIHGICFVPEIDETIRNYVREMDITEVQRRMVGFPFQDSQRLRRGLEVLLSTGKPLSYFQEQPRQKIIDAVFKKILVLPPRDVLYDRCNRRFDQMLANGAVSEVEALLKQPVIGSIQKAIGVPEITAYLNKEISFQTMVEKAKQSTRQYAKRQTTWFKHQFQADEIVS